MKGKKEGRNRQMNKERRTIRRKCLNKNEVIVRQD